MMQFIQGLNKAYIHIYSDIDMVQFIPFIWQLLGKMTIPNVLPSHFHNAILILT